MRIVFLGSPGFAVQTLELLIQNGHEITAVYTRPDKPAGRGRETTAPPLKQAALRLNLPVVQVTTFKDQEAVAQLAGFNAEALVVAAYGQILPETVLNISKHGCLNIHPSLLPKYRGPSPVASALLSGDEFAGVSVMQLDPGMDSGPVYSRAQIPVLDSDTTASLTPRLFYIGSLMLLEVISNLEKGKVATVPQDSAAATFTREISKEEGLIDWSSPAESIWRKARAYFPWPGIYTHWNARQLKIVECFPLPDITDIDPGRVASLPSGSPAPIAVGTSQGALAVKTLQIEGKKAMDAGEFIRGQRDFTNSVLG